MQRVAVCGVGQIKIEGREMSVAAVWSREWWRASLEVSRLRII